MKENIRTEINYGDKKNNKLEIIDDKTEYLKNNNIDNKISEKPCQKNLQYFISNTKKFKFSSAFDHKGAKSFLKSKGKALKEISIDDNSSEQEEKDMKKNSSLKIHNKDTNKKKKKDITSDNEKIKTTNHDTINNSHSDNTLKIKKKKKLESYIDNQIYIRKFLNEEFNVKKKKAKKFCSQIELKMFNDKSLYKLKPIKEKIVKVHKNIKEQNFNNNRINTDFSFVNIDTSHSDSTLLNIVSEFK